MIKVKIFESLNIIELERKINNFIDENNIQNIISFSTEMNKFDRDENNMLAFIVYTSNELLTE